MYIEHSPRALAVGLALLAVGLPCVSTAQAGDALVLPESTAEQLPMLRCHVVIGQEAVHVDGVQVLSLDAVQDEDGVELLAVPGDLKRGQLVTPLYERLQEKREQAKLQQDGWRSLAVLTQRPELDPGGELLLSIDADTPFSVVREVLYTAGQAQYGSFRLVTHNPWQDAQRTVTVDLPAIGPPRAVDLDLDARPPLMLSIGVTDGGLDIRGADMVLDPDAKDYEGDRPPTVPCLGEGVCEGVDDYDWMELTRLLGLIKQEYPDALQVIVVPERDIPYEVIVRVLDCARWHPLVPMDADHDAWEHWQAAREQLFPWPVVAGGVE